GGAHTTPPAPAHSRGGPPAPAPPPAAIDTVLLTHIHPDHALGLLDADGGAVFPNAELVVHEAEAAFWLNRDAGAGASERIRRNIAKGQAACAPYRGRLRAVRAGNAR